MHIMKCKVAGACSLVALFLILILWKGQGTSFQLTLARLHVVSKHSKTLPSRTLPPSVVPDCISGKPLFTVRTGVQLEEFDIQSETQIRREKSDDRMSSFQNVYKNKIWGVDKSYKGLQGSGGGSTSHFAQNMIKILNAAIDKVKATTGKQVVRFLDIPCGDIVWIPQLLESRTDVQYTGMDIVPELIENHRKRYKHKRNWKFVHADIVANKLNDTYDIIHCRHMLQHLWTIDAMKALFHFSQGGKYLVTTTWPTTAKNDELKDVNGGRFRPLNLEMPPFRLPPPLCFGEDWPPGSDYTDVLFAGMWKLPLKQIPSEYYESKHYVTSGRKIMYSPMYMPGE